MKFATFKHKDRITVGMLDVEEGRVWPLETILERPVDTMLQLIEGYDRIKADLKPGGSSLAMSEIELLAPIPRPLRNIFCIGKNYREHAEEFAKSGFDSSSTSNADAIPDVPIVFTKAPETVIGNGCIIRYPTGVSNAVDYEAELGVIIGKGGRGISRHAASDHIWGYTIINDVTARDWQARHKQWFLGKSFDTFCPMGPWFVTADEIDVSNLRIQCWVNDELRQDANTGDLLFDISRIIETISAGITLFPGDIIATGTPQGVGIGFDPPRYLIPGDSIRISIEGLGVLENQVKLSD